MKRNTLATLTFVFALTPAMAFAHPIQSTGSHMRPNLFHDRSPHYQRHNLEFKDRGPVAHH